MEDGTAKDTEETSKDAPAPRHARTDTPRSPFGRNRKPSDDWVGFATVAVAAMIVVVGAYLAWNMIADKQQRDTQSPAARSVANLAAVVTKNPNDPGARVKLAEAMMANGQQDEAVEQLQAALQIDKEYVAALTDLGLIAMDRKEWTKAEGYWTKLIGILGVQEMSGQDARLADVYYYLGTTFVEQKRYEEAVANLGESVTIKRDSSPVHYMLSVAYDRLGLFERQAEELEIVLAFDPQHAQANYDKGMLLLKQGDLGGAAEFFRIADDNAPKGIIQPQAQLDLLGKAADRFAKAVELEKSDPKAALMNARVAAALDPTDVAAVRLVARLWEVEKDTAKALNAWQRVLEMLPGDVQATESVKRLSANAK